MPVLGYHHLPRGPCETPWCLAAKIDSPLSRDNFWLAITLAHCLLKCLQNCLAHKRGDFLLFQNDPRGEGNCETTERLKLSRGNFCPATSICLFWPTGSSYNPIRNMAVSRANSRTTSEPTSSYELSWALPFKTRVRGQKFIWTRLFGRGSRTCLWTSHVSDWIAGRGTDLNRKKHPVHKFSARNSGARNCP